MARLFIGAAMAAILGACAAATPVALSAPPLAARSVERPAAPVTCTIQATRTANGLRLQPAVASSRALDGEYEFTLSKSGGSGASDVSQGGPVSLDAPGQLALGASEINRDGQIRAHLVIREAGRVLCSADFRS